jgi:hypothetical protein
MFWIAYCVTLVLSTAVVAVAFVFRLAFETVLRLFNVRR